MLDDIFGQQQGNTFLEGLVDSENEDDFELKLDVLQKRWADIEVRHNTKQGFFSWFLKNKVEIMKNTMLKNIRQDAGLGSPPQVFTTNASETTNSIIKAHVSHKPSELMDFVQHLKDIVDEQEHEVERAIIRQGKYRFKDDYLHLEVSEDKWFGMSQEQRKAHIKKVAFAKVVEEPTTSLSTSASSAVSMAMDIDEVALKVDLPLLCLQGIWQKAENLLSSSNNIIVPAPGHPSDAKMVASQSTQ